MLVITRFHDVLFKTDAFYDALFQQIKNEKITKDVWQKAYDQMMEEYGSFQLQPFLKILSREVHVSKFLLVRKIDRALSEIDLRDYVYPDWFEFRRKLSSSCSTAVFVGVIFGEVVFEKKLVERAGLKQVFDDVFYAILKPDEVLGDILQKYPKQRVVYCDTSAHHLEFLEKQFPEILIIAVNRNPMKTSQKCSVRVCVKDFEEVYTLVSQRFFDPVL